MFGIYITVKFSLKIKILHYRSIYPKTERNLVLISRSKDGDYVLVSEANCQKWTWGGSATLTVTGIKCIFVTCLVCHYLTLLKMDIWAKYTLLLSALSYSGPAQKDTFCLSTVSLCTNFFGQFMVPQEFEIKILIFASSISEEVIITYQYVNLNY